VSDARRIDKDRDIVTRLILEAELRRTARRYVGTQPAPGEPSFTTSAEGRPVASLAVAALADLVT
jgi:hypothetical protein